MKTKSYIISVIAIVFAVLLSGCSEDIPNPSPEVNELENPFSLFRIDSVPETATGVMLRHITLLSIVDKNGNNLLDADNPNNVLDNHFYVEYKDQIINMEVPRNEGIFKDDETGCFEFLMTCRDALETPYFFHPHLTIGLGFMSKNGMLDKTFTFVWPERNIRKEIRVLLRAWSKDNYMYWQMGTLFDGKPSGDLLELVVD